MRSVYIVNKGGHDYSDAARYGDVKFITEGIIKDRFNPSSLYRLCAEALKDSTPQDLIVLTSLTLLCSIACSVFARKHGFLNLLMFKDGKYIERSVDIDSLI